MYGKGSYSKRRIDDNSMNYQLGNALLNEANDGVVPYTDVGGVRKASVPDYYTLPNSSSGTVQGAVETNLETLFSQLAPKGCLVCVDAASETATRRTGKAMRYDRIGGDISGRPLFDITLPVIEEFRFSPTFTF